MNTKIWEAITAGSIPLQLSRFKVSIWLFVGESIAKFS